MKAAVAAKAVSTAKAGAGATGAVAMDRLRYVLNAPQTARRRATLRQSTATADEQEI